MANKFEVRAGPSSQSVRKQECLTTFYEVIIGESINVIGVEHVKLLQCSIAL